MSITQFHNPLLNSDENRKRKASTWILGDYPEENLSRATKKLKSESRLVLDEEEEEGSCVTSTSCSRVSVQHKSEPSLRAATMKCRFAETILRAQQKQGLVKSVDVERYKLDAKEEVRKAVQKQREAARLTWVVDEDITWFIDISSGPFLCVMYMMSETQSNEASLKTCSCMWRRGALDFCLCF